MSQPLTSDEHRDFARALSRIMIRAGELSLYRTQHRIHDAVREIGWEMAGVPTPESQDFYFKTSHKGPGEKK